MAEALLQLRDAGVQIDGKSLLQTATLSIYQNDFVAVLGANGAGKSTLLRAAHGIAPLSSGARSAIAATQQAMVFQRPPLLRRTVQANIEFVLDARGIENPERALRVDAALRACRIDQLSAQQARSLSGGEQQRLALACALALKPRLLFADEPTASLDIHAVHEVEALLRTLHAQGTAVMMTTHSLAQAKRLAQRIVFIHNGEVTDDIAASLFFAGTQSAPARLFFEGERL